MGSRGDSYDNALAESVIGLFKTEVIRPQGRWRSLERSSSPRWPGSIGSTRGGSSSIGYVPPAEYEAQYYQQVEVA